MHSLWGEHCRLLRFHHTFILTDDYFHLRVTLADAMRSMDVSRSPGSLTRMFPFCVTCSQLMYLYVPVPVSRVFLLYRFGLSTRLYLRFSLMLTPFVLSTRLQSHYSWTMTRTVTRLLLRLFVLVSHSLIYIRLRMRTRSSSSIYFATTLVV